MQEAKKSDIFDIVGQIVLLCLVLFFLFACCDGYFRWGIIRPKLCLGNCKEDIAAFVKKYKDANPNTEAVRKQAIDLADKYRAIGKLQDMSHYNEEELKELMGIFYVKE